MKFWVGVTDNDWFEFLAQLKPDEVNFWQPGGGKSFKILERDSPFLFKLHSPRNFIVGGGFFERHSSNLPVSLVWEAFGPKNGAPDYETFLSKILEHRKSREPDPLIGCIVLKNPFFFEQSDWIPIPKDWKLNIVTGKYYDTLEPIGGQLWSRVEMTLRALAIYGPDYLVHRRLGQGAFRVNVTEAYNRKCAITGERTLPVLQAAHIKPVSENGSNEISNGLLLRADLHILFDEGLITITEKLNIKVSKKIREKYENGRDYYSLQGGKLRAFPENDRDRPSIELLRWHNQNIFAA